MAETEVTVDQAAADIEGLFLTVREIADEP
jgi:hypothetical protein